jgi:hypothetical protein
MGRAIRACLADEHDPGAAFVAAIRARPISMLSAETLGAIHLLSRTCRGAIVEIGAYVGGATAVILHATQARRNLVVTIEEPVEHLTHPQIPTRNTVADLHANIRALGLEREGHYVLPGASFEAWVVGTLHHRLMGQQVELLVWDADACVDRDLILLAPWLAAGAMLVIDDYVAGEGKSVRVSAVVDDLMRRGIVAPAAYLPWGTWFGRLRRTPTAAEIAAYRADWRRLADAGHVYYRRLIDYERRLPEPPPPLTAEERRRFWASAVAWGRMTAGQEPARA